MKAPCFLLLSLLFVAGCTTPATNQSAVVVEFPRWRLEEPVERVTCRVIRTNEIQLDTLIRVRVRGDVRHPGFFEVPAGTTVLEAIAKAGGFSDSAYTGSILVMEGSTVHHLYRNGNKKLPLRPGGVWYGASGSKSDFVLKPNAAVYVSRRM